MRSASRGLVTALHRDERGQSLAIILALITILFLLGSALAAHTSAALRTTAANEAQAGDLRAADAGAELGMWWQRNGKVGDPPSISVNGHTVTTTVGISGATACPTPSLIVVTGFEHGLATATAKLPFSAVAGSSVSADNALARTGTYSLRVADTGSGANNASLALGTDTAVVRLYLRLPSLPATDVTELFKLDAAAGNDPRVGYQASSDRFTFRFANAAVTLSTSTVAPNTWYRFDLRFVASTNPRTADWQVDGVAQTSISATGNATTINALRLGSTVSADALTANYDDVIASDTAADYPLGPGTVLPIRPSGLGTGNNVGSFQNDDGSTIDGSTAGRLAESPMDDATTYVRQQTIGTGDYVELQLDDVAATCVTGVSALLAYHAAGSAADRGTASLYDGSTQRVIYDGDMSQAAIRYAATMVSPAASAWTVSAVNGLKARIGYSSDVTPNPYWDSLLLEVSTGIYVPGTVTVTSSAGSSTVTTTYTDVGSSAPNLLSWSTTR